MPTTRLALAYLQENNASAATVMNGDLDLIDAGTALLAAANTFTAQNHFTGTPPASTSQAQLRLGNRALPATMAAAGTAVGGNWESSFTGDLIRLLVNDAQVFRLGSGGAIEGASFRQSGGNRGLTGGYAFFIATTTPATDADHTVGSAEYVAPFLSLAAGAWTSGHNVILPTTAGGLWIVTNNSGFTATFKTAAGAGIAVATARRAILACSNAVDIRRVTADTDPTV